MMVIFCFYCKRGAYLMSVNNSKKIFQTNKEKYLKSLFNLLNIESISTLSEKRDDCKKCANFLKDYLKNIGFSSELISTNGNPVVFAEYKLSDTAKTVLIYNHYDVQPIDPISEWKTEPFKPTIKDGKIFARGAEDNKGQLFFIVTAIESLIKESNIGFNVKFIIDGEEECGSVGTSLVLDGIKDKLSCDYLLVCDTSTVNKNVASIVLGLRGMCCFDVKLSGLKSDLHSGVYGGVVQNPAIEIVKLISTLYDEDGKIRVKNFYDGVMPLNKIDTTKIIDFDIKGCEAQTGVFPSGGEKGILPSIRAGFRPTIEINGISSGYQGEGVKTIIPSFAIAKFSCRLVQDQDPDKIFEVIKKHLENNNNSNLKLDVIRTDEGAFALNIDVNNEGILKATNALKKVCGDVVYIWEGGSIPILTKLSKILNKEAILAGFGLDEDRIHAPNESFPIEQFEKGFCFCREFFSK